MLKEQKLTEKELRGYRQWLSELDVESREEQESSRQTVDPDIWRVFNPEGNIGRQIYESYTDEALLEAVVGTMDHPGHKPRLYQLSLIRQVYLKRRFGSTNKACWAAKGFRKRLEEQKRWPPGEEEITPELKKLFQKKRCTNKRAMELMGIPVLSKLAMKHLWSYWLSAWREPAGPSERKTGGDAVI